MRSQIHKERIQSVRSDGSKVAVALDNALVNQTSAIDTPDSYQFASNSFSTAYGALAYKADSVVGGVPVPLVSGITFTESTRTFNWTKGAGTYIVRVTAINATGQQKTDDFDIVVS